MKGQVNSSRSRGEAGLQFLVWGRVGIVQEFLVKEKGRPTVLGRGQGSKVLGSGRWLDKNIKHHLPLYFVRNW